MIHRQVDEYDIEKLERARQMVDSVEAYYYTSENSRDLTNRLDTISRKLSGIIADAREWNRTHDRFGNKIREDQK